MMQEYSDIECIDQGKYGTIYRAIDQQQRVVAIKMPTGPDSRLAHEAMILRHIHANGPVAGVPQLLDTIGEEHERSLSLVMEYIEGQRFDDIEWESLSVALVLDYISQFLSIVNSLHTHRQVVHRDLHDGNILVTPEHRVVLVDFGNALFINQETSRDCSDETIACLFKIQSWLNFFPMVHDQAARYSRMMLNLWLDDVLSIGRAGQMRRLRMDTLLTLWQEHLAHLQAALHDLFQYPQEQE